MSIETFGGRKFIFAVICLIAGIAMQILKPGSVTTEFVALLLGLSASFTVGNVIAKGKTPTAVPSVSEPQPAVEEPVVQEAVEEEQLIEELGFETRVAQLELQQSQMTQILNQLIPMVQQLQAQRK